MQTTSSFRTICLLMLLTTSGGLAAKDKRYGNIHRVTHVSGGWVAFSNGELYQCRFSKNDKGKGPECNLASGLPTKMQSVSVLWGEGDDAWVAYTDGQVYGCRRQPEAAKAGPACLPAGGLP